jgi:hypothetical protein
MDGPPARTAERPSVDFSWEGQDEGDPVSGRGWVTLRQDGSLSGHIDLHHGDDSGFKAVPFDDGKPRTSRSPPKARRRR